VELIADKTLNGKTPATNAFTFKMVEIDADGNEVAGTEQIVKNRFQGRF